MCSRTRTCVSTRRCLTGPWDATRALDTTAALKLAHEFDRPVFPDGPDALSWAPGSDLVFWHFFSGGSEVVVAWAAGPGARDLSARGEGERFDIGLTALSGVLSEAFVDPAPERVSLDRIGRMNRDRAGAEVRLSSAAEYGPFNTWLDLALFD